MKSRIIPVNPLAAKAHHPIAKNCAIYLRGYLAGLRNQQWHVTNELIQLCEDIALLEEILKQKDQ
jgi:hypothetical protein